MTVFRTGSGHSRPGSSPGSMGAGLGHAALCTGPGVLLSDSSHNNSNFTKIKNYPIWITHTLCRSDFQNIITHFQAISDIRRHLRNDNYFRPNGYLLSYESLTFVKK